MSSRNIICIYSDGLLAGDGVLGIAPAANAVSAGSAFLNAGEGIANNVIEINDGGRGSRTYVPIAPSYRLLQLSRTTTAAATIRRISAAASSTMAIPTPPTNVDSFEIRRQMLVLAPEMRRRWAKPVPHRPPPSACGSLRMSCDGPGLAACGRRDCDIDAVHLPATIGRGET